MSKRITPVEDNGKHVQKLAKMIKDLNKRSGDSAGIESQVTEDGLAITIRIPASAITVSAGRICVDSRTMATLAGIQQTMC